MISHLTLTILHNAEHKGYTSWSYYIFRVLDIENCDNPVFR